MIRNVPLDTDFKAHGVDYMNLGWGAILSVLTDFEHANEWASGLEPEMAEEFWDAAERELATALTLVMQGAEFLLKAKICSVSPWLLVASSPSDWPRRCDKEDTDYSEFRTIDAHDLIKVHDTFLSSRLPEEFVEVFSNLRRERNSIMHSVCSDLEVNAKSLIERILVLSEHLVGPQAWAAARREYIYRDKISAIDLEHVDFRVAEEFVLLIELLGAASLKRFFGYNKKQRVYGCPTCSRAYAEFGLECKTAQLRPNTAGSTTLFCFICGNEVTVERRDCNQGECKGNVYDPDDNQCLTCMQHQD
ncbi:hypothetical protein [Verrucomicrobium sp. BvORR034]|uniref:hypothetical protein n=1 Tax=Verrucomicrobium sp. BvORR034 TaxID=1396418 RepID=UPI0006798330|nr:hypothetical protein [Verrucomicrobium sp. BvORR034]